LLLGALLLCFVLGTLHARRPSLLVHCARPALSQWSWWVDLDYLRELHAKGFEVDYTDRHADFTWDRVRRYDVLVLYTVPLESGKYLDNSPDQPPYRDEFIGIVERFLQDGGSVLLMARSINGDETFRPLIERWGARIPHERIEESDPERVRPMPRMRGKEKLWFTDAVLESPVSRGVQQVWLPFTPHYRAAETMPIEVSPDWTVVLRGGPSSRTRPTDSGGTRWELPPRARIREGGVREPDLFAIRRYAAGRIAFCAIWPQYSIGQGTRWLYERRVLERGIDGRPSHFGRLIENTLRWLAEPRRAASPDRGFRTDLERLRPPNLRSGAEEAMLRKSLRQAPDPTRALEGARGGRILRGLIGASTTWGGGRGGVREYAAAARDSGLDFVVFLERYSALVPAGFERLRRRCRAHSDTTLRLIPGYWLETNTGNRIFFFGEEIELLPGELLFDGRLSLQDRDPVSGDYVAGTRLQRWLQRSVLARDGANVGYFGFSDREQALPLEDLRLYSVAALRLFRGGQQVEENLPAYLRCAADGLPPAPVALHLLDSPADLRDAAADAKGLTYLRADDLDELRPALSYAGLFRAPQLFVSSGPMIELWPMAKQHYTLAAEDYVSRPARLSCPLAIRSETGLREVRIYQGERLFRRFLCHGERRFETVLELSAAVQRTLVVVAEDLRGGVAVGNALRAWKAGDLTPVLCGDRINHCTGQPWLAKGPGAVQVHVTPAIDGGQTWDGGPQGLRPLVRFVHANRPVLTSSKGIEGRNGFQNRAVVELSDEGVARVSATLARLYETRVPVVNAWGTYGPLAGPTRLFRSKATLTVFDRPVVGPQPYGYPGVGEKSGAEVSLFENRFEFLKKQRVHSLKLFHQQPYKGGFPVTVTHGRGEEIRRSYTLTPAGWPQDDLILLRGDWLAFSGPPSTNPSVHFNRGEPMRVRSASRKALALLFEGALDGFRVRRGEAHPYELLSLAFPLGARPLDASRLLRLVRLVDRPPGLELLHGRRLRDDGWPIEIEAEGGWAALRLGPVEPDLAVPIPLRISGLHPRWSAGVLLVEGYTAGRYGPGRNRYRSAGLDAEGRAYATLFAHLAPRTEVVVGHPVVCDRRELFVEVTRLDDEPAPGRWSVTVHNPTERSIETRCSLAFAAPGLAIFEGTLRIEPGAERSLDRRAPGSSAASGLSDGDEMPAGAEVPATLRQRR
jgi:hypothetical protein